MQLRSGAQVELRVLGARQGGSADGRASALLIDRTIALDVGGLCGGLSWRELSLVEHVLLTHHRFDHVRDLPFLGLTVFDGEWPPLTVHCSPLVHDILRRDLFNGVVWPDFFAPLPGSARAPALMHHPVVAGEEFSLGRYRVLALHNPSHSVPVVAYQFSTPEDRRLLVTGDSGPGVRDVWVRAQPDLLLVPVTAPDRLDATYAPIGHLTPARLETELAGFRAIKSYLPRVVVMHVAQAHVAEIAGELAEVAARLGAAIDIAHDGLRLQV